MKRNRNSFFTNYNAQQQTFIPDGIPMPNQQIPYTQSSMNSNYYSGPALTNSNDIDYITVIFKNENNEFVLNKYITNSNSRSTQILTTAI